MDDGPNRIVPVFRIQPDTGPEADSTPDRGRTGAGVRAMTNLVGPVVGLMDQHPNRAPGLVAAGAEILIRPVRVREVS